ncbi:MAG: 4-(cytidine 5'-diphospho)-2-C-methyl-D-erythritol kinase [Sphingomicrobium sp.]
MSVLAETAYAKLNLALHVRGKRADGYHDIETIFAFCENGDELSGENADELSLEVTGPFAADVPAGDKNLLMKAARALKRAADAKLRLTKHLPASSGIGGGSADAAAALRLLGLLWGIDRSVAERVAPLLGADVPACLLSQTCRGSGSGSDLTPVELPEIAGTPVLLVNPRIPLPTADVFARWDGVDRGPLGDWREGRNDLQAAATAVVPAIAEMLSWLEDRPGADVVRMSGSGATCFALFGNETERDSAAAAVPPEWWHLATRLR